MPDRGYPHCPTTPLLNHSAYGVECLGHKLPDTLIFEAAKVQFDDAILFRGKQRAVFLQEAVVAIGLTTGSIPEDRAIVAAEDGRVDRAERAKPLQARHFNEPFSSFVCLID